MVLSEFMQRIFECGDIPDAKHTPDEELNSLIYGMLSYDIV